MKNMPEKNFWNSIKSRLQAYTENPEEEAWDKIVAALPPKPAAKGYTRTAGLALLVLASFIGGIVTSQYYGYISQRLFEHHNPMRSDYNDISKNQKTDVGDAKSFRSQNPSAAMMKSDNTSEMFVTNLHRNKDVSSHNYTSDNTQSITNRIFTTDEHAIHQQKQAQNVFENAVSISAVNQQVKVENDSTVSNQARQNNYILAINSVQDSAVVNESRTIEKKILNEEKHEQYAVKRKRVLHPQLYVVLIPSLSFQKATPRTDDDKVISDLVSPGVFSEERMGYALEVGYQRAIAKNLEFYSSISYYHQRQKISYNVMDPSQVEIIPDTQGGYSITPGSTTQTFNYGMSNVGMSAGVFYQIKSSKLMHKVGAGLHYQKGMLRGVSEQVYDNSKSMYLNYQLSYRMEYCVRTSTHIFFQPTLTHAFYAKEYMNGPLTVKPYRAGFGVGVLHQF